MFKSIFLFEFRKLFNKRFLIIFLIAFIILAAFSYEGISDFKEIVKSKAPFQEAEKEKVKLLIHYTFYGIRGVRLLFIPSSISVLFNDLSVYSGLAANVDSAEGLSICNSINGKELFAGAGGYMDFSGLSLLIAGCLALIYGFTITRNDDYLKMLADLAKCERIHIKVILARIILLSLCGILLYFFSLLWLYINGIPVNASFLLYLVILVPVLAFFITTGAFIGHFKHKMIQFSILGILYFSLVFLIPWIIKKFLYIEATTNICSTYELEYDKFKVMMVLEKRLYDKFGVWKSQGIASDDIKNTIQSGQDIEYKQLQEYENERIESLSRRIKIYQLVSSFFPTTFYLSSNQELGSKGYLNFIRFYKYAHEMKYRFIKFYIEKKFYTPLPVSGVEPFVKGDENLFAAESQLPVYFPLGISLTLLYTLAILMYLYQIKIPVHGKKINKPAIEFKNGLNSLFVLCQDPKIKREILDYYQQQSDAVYLEKINTADFHFDITTDDFFKYLCKINRADEKKAVHNLSLLKIEDLKKDAPNFTHETILKIYAAIKMSGSQEYIIFDDFFKNESRKFENDFDKLLVFILNSGKKIIYLGSEMFFSKMGSEIIENINTQKFMVLPLQVGKVTLR